MMRAIIIIIALGTGCVAPRVITPVARGHADQPPVVVILTSSNNRLYEAPVTSFQSQLEGEATVYAETVAEPRGLAEAVQAVKPTLIFALGTQAAIFARQKLPDVPLLFAMVVNHRRLKELQAPQVMGVALEVPPASEFTQFKLALPGMNRVLVLHASENTSDVVAGATEAARSLGITLVAAPVRDLAELKTQYDRYSKQVDAVWLLNDPVVMNPAAFAWLREASYRDRVALISSLSEKFARAGALMSVSVDLSSLGFQASAMATGVLKRQQTLSEIGVQPPIGARLVLNMVVAQKLGLQVPEEVLPFISEVIVSEGPTTPRPDVNDR